MPGCFVLSAVTLGHTWCLLGGMREVELCIAVAAAVTNAAAVAAGGGVCWVDKHKASKRTLLQSTHGQS